MSQKEILKILKRLGGEATSSEIREQAKQEFPDRHLFNYVSMRLNSLEKRNLVSKRSADDKKYWKITQKGKNKPLKKHIINDSCNNVNKKRLENERVDIVNIVSVVYNKGKTSFDLYQISQDLPNSTYNPETDGYLNFYPTDCENATIRVPSSGNLNIAGAKSKQEVFNGISSFENRMSELGYDIEISPHDIEVQNILGTSSIQKEIDLAKLASDMADCAEYSADNNPNLIFRPEAQGTIMIYRTGKTVAIGVKTYQQMIYLYKQLNDRVPTIENAEIPFN